MKKSDLQSLLIFLLVGVLGAVIFLSGVSSGWYRQWPEPLVLEVSDHPLLTEEQKEEARETDRVAFNCCGMHYVIESGARDGLANYINPTVTLDFEK